MHTGTVLSQNSSSVFDRWARETWVRAMPEACAAQATLWQVLWQQEHIKEAKLFAVRIGDEGYLCHWFHLNFPTSHVRVCVGVKIRFPEVKCNVFVFCCLLERHSAQVYLGCVHVCKCTHAHTYNNMCMSASGIHGKVQAATMNAHITSMTHTCVCTWCDYVLGEDFLCVFQRWLCCCLQQTFTCQCEHVCITPNCVYAVRVLVVLVCVG